jgi:hypothetical protein
METRLQTLGSSRKQVNYSAAGVDWVSGCEGAADASSAPLAAASTALSGRHLLRTFLAAGWDSSSVDDMLDEPCHVHEVGQGLTSLIDILYRVQAHLSRWRSEHD